MLKNARGPNDSRPDIIEFYPLAAQTRPFAGWGIAMKQIFMKIDKLVEKSFWPLVAVFLIAGAYETIRDYGKPHSTWEKINLDDENPPCVNARNERVQFEPRQHKVFVNSGMTGLTAVKDEKTILFDYDELSKTPAENRAAYRDFVLRVACARNADFDAQAADCIAIKRLRDEKAFSKEQVTLIAQSLPASPADADDKEARTRNLYACFDAPK
ncbi:MAG: hypothetical protein ACREDT_01565 [Methylocella sp.]